MSPFGISCGTCKNFDSSMPDLPEGDGACRAHAPVTQLLMVPSQHKLTGQTMMSPQQFSLYPRVNGERDFCGEWIKPLTVSITEKPQPPVKPLGVGPW